MVTMDIFFIYFLMMDAGSKKDLRVFSWVKRIDSLMFFSLFIKNFFQKLVNGKKKGRKRNTLGERSTTESCMLRLGRMNRS